MRRRISKDQFMENIPFLGLDEETALANGPNSLMQQNTTHGKKLAGQFQTAVLNKQVVYSLKCTVPLPIYSFLKTVSALNQLLP